MTNVTAMVEEHVQMNESMVQMGDTHNLGVENLGHSEEVETLTMEAMEVDVQVYITFLKREFSRLNVDHDIFGLSILSRLQK